MKRVFEILGDAGGVALLFGLLFAGLWLTPDRPPQLQPADTGQHAPLQP